MHFRKIHHPCNFIFADTYTAKSAGRGDLHIDGCRFGVRIEDHGDEVFRLTVRDRRWSANRSQAGVVPSVGDASRWQLHFDRHATLSLNDERGHALLGGIWQESFGVCGTAWMLQFQPDPAYRFYGMGEKLGGLEKSGTRTKFWNTDVMADFAISDIERGITDPMYVSIPWLVVKRQGRYLGILVDNPYAVFISANGRIGSSASPQDAQSRVKFYLGSDKGLPDVWIIVGPDLPSLTRKYQRLVGTTPLPPLWSLGHHQCRWGYAGPKDLRRIRARFRQYRIPNDGLWLDIDYMQDFKVFTFNSRHFKDVAAEIAELQATGQHVVPILDPGVKNEEGYSVRDDGLRHKVFCLTPEGKPYSGFVWPGNSLFPDFCREDASRWWAAWVRRFAGHGIHGAWLDMNDPSVGPVEYDNMLFDAGTETHDSYHNQYALGMARASRAGFLAAHPDRRPFLISRSGFTGIQKYAAIWTGDNLSSDTYVKGSIPCSLNLALSGIPFNGPDVPGFARDATAELMVRWYKAGFLFPFLRNHCCHGNRDQEPWVFGARVRQIVAHLIRLRYKLMPYLYNLFVEHESSGEAVMRPCFYDFPGDEGLDRLDDQYMLGPALMHAPVVEADVDRRKLRLPQADWFDLGAGHWRRGGRTVTAIPTAGGTPLYARRGCLVSMTPGLPTDNRIDLANIELHCFLKPGDTATYRYRCDDGETFAYRRGERSDVTLTVAARRDRLDLFIGDADLSWKPIRLHLVAYGRQTEVRIASTARHGARVMKPAEWTCTGDKLACVRSGIITIE